jgi:hypothetical protein
MELLPIGWYVPEFDVELPSSEDTEHARPMVLVWGDEKEHYDALLDRVASTDLRRLADPGLQYDAIETQIEAWRDEFFPERRQRGGAIGMNLFHLVRHLGQAGGKLPPFFPFEQRDDHDLTPLVNAAAIEDWGPSRTRQQLEAVYVDGRRFWRAMYPTFDLFRNQFRVLVEAEIQRRTGSGADFGIPNLIAPATPLPDLEPSEEVKKEVIRRDGGRCLCCGISNIRRLQVDHIISRYHGGTNDPSNLQTLCSVCNKDKDIQEMHFRNEGTLLKSPPPLRFPAGFNSPDLDDIAHDIQRTINMFYQCAAVDEIERKRKGLRRREWCIRLRSGNPRAWFDGHMADLLRRVMEAQEDGRSEGVRSLILEAPTDGSQKRHRVYVNRADSRRPLAASAIRPRMAVAVYEPDNLDMPSEPLQGKVIRVDAKKRQADVRVTIGRTVRELPGVPFKAIFGPDVLNADDEEQE